MSNYSIIHQRLGCNLTSCYPQGREIFQGFYPARGLIEGYRVRRNGQNAVAKSHQRVYPARGLIEGYRVRRNRQNAVAKPQLRFLQGFSPACGLMEEYRVMRLRQNTVAKSHQNVVGILPCQIYVIEGY
jgi:hypothetical protein